MNFFQRQVVICLIEGLLYGTGFMLVGLPYGFLIGFALGVMNLIPLFGSVVCLPVGSPKCGDCPLRASCRAFQNHTQEDYPVRSAKKPRRTEERTILLIRDKDHILLAKRPPGGLLAGLYEPVNLPGVLDARDAGDYVKRLGLSPESIRCLPPARHIFTHIEWRMGGFLVGTSSLTGIDTEKTGLLPAGIDQLHTRYALPSAYRPYMEILSRKLTGGD